MRVIVVTGTRRAAADNHRQHIDATLTSFADGWEHVTLVHGAASGVDTLAAAIGREHGWAVRAYPAAWDVCTPECPPSANHRRPRPGRAGGTYCPGAGPRRNRTMIDAWFAYEPVVAAFPLLPLDTGSGTFDAMRYALNRGLTVHTAGLVVEPATLFDLNNRRTTPDREAS